jgi:hypothetical protein
MTPNAFSLIAAVHRLAAADRRACARVARLLDIGELDAQIVVGMVGGARVTSPWLQAEFDLSPGGAAALADRLARELLVCGERDPDDPQRVRLRLRDGARRELEAALAGHADELLRIVDSLPADDRGALHAWCDRDGARSSRRGARGES